jgi:hypothetical protein
MKLQVIISLLALSGLALAQSPSPYPTPPIPFASPTPVVPDPQFYGGPSAAEAAFNAKVMSLAKSYLGTENNSGDNEDPDRNVPNPKIEELAHSVFHGDVPSEEFYGGWCDWFVTAILEKAGLTDITETMFGMLQMSKAHFVVTPIPGDIVLLQGHIAFYAGEDPAAGYIWILGGNQEYSTDANTVSHSSYSSYNYYGGSSDSHKKKPFEVHGLDIPHGSSTDSDDNGGIDVHVTMPKKNVKRGFGVNYAKVQRSDIQIIYRMNPPK